MMPSSSTIPSTGRSLMNLPPELRLQIYSYLFAAFGIDDCTSRNPSTAPQLSPPTL